MCEDTSCKVRRKCYRYMAYPSIYQSYQATFRESKNSKCADFWSCKGHTVRKDYKEIDKKLISN